MELTALERIKQGIAPDPWRSTWCQVGAHHYCYNDKFPGSKCECACHKKQ